MTASLPTVPKHGLLSGMILPGLAAALVLPLGLLSPAFRSHFAAPLSTELEVLFFLSIVAMAVHKLESYWFGEFDQCPVYLAQGQAQWAQNPRRLIFLTFVPVFLGMMGLTFLGFLGPPWHLLALTIWLAQGAHELHHLAKSLSRARAYPGVVSSLLFVGLMWFGLFPRWHDAVLGERGLFFTATWVLLPVVFVAFYVEDRRWTAKVPREVWSPESGAVHAPVNGRA